jgi:hypothetical protein
MMQDEAYDKVLARQVGYTPCVSIKASALASLVPPQVLNPAVCHLVTLASIIFPYHEAVLQTPDDTHEFIKRHMGYKVKEATREHPLWVRAVPVARRTVLRFLIRRGMIFDAQVCRQITAALHLFPNGWKFRIMSQPFIDGGRIYFHLAAQDQAQLSEYLLAPSPA